MEQQPQTYRLIWQGIEIEARCWPHKWGVTAHLEIDSINPPSVRRCRSPTPDTAHTFTNPAPSK